MAEWLGRALCESHGASSILDSVTFLAQKQGWGREQKRVRTCPLHVKVPRIRFCQGTDSDPIRAIASFRVSLKVTPVRGLLKNTEDMNKTNRRE